MFSHCMIIPQFVFHYHLIDIKMFPNNFDYEKVTEHDGARDFVSYDLEFYKMAVPCYNYHQQYMRIPIVLHFCQNLVLSNLHHSFSSVSQSFQSLSHAQLFVTPGIATQQASLSITSSRSLLKLMPIESVMPSSHLILCRPLLLLPPIPPRITVFPMSQLFA